MKIKISQDGKLEMGSYIAYLAIPEVNPKTLQECFRAMEKVKQKEISIPIILETYDNTINF